MSETFRTTTTWRPRPNAFSITSCAPSSSCAGWVTSRDREACDGGVFSVDAIRGHFVRVDRAKLIEIAWGEAGNEAMTPGATRLRVTFEARGPITRVELTHTGLVPSEAAKHAIGWPHFIERLRVTASGRDPGPDPWKSSPPTATGTSVQKPPARAT